MRTDKVDLDYLKRYRNPMLMTLEILILPAGARGGSSTLQQSHDCVRSLQAETKPHFDFYRPRARCDGRSRSHFVSQSVNKTQMSHVGALNVESAQSKYV